MPLRQRLDHDVDAPAPLDRVHVLGPYAEARDPGVGVHRLDRHHDGGLGQRGHAVLQPHVEEVHRGRAEQAGVTDGELFVLARQATWLMSSEAAAARAYWTGFDSDQPVYDGFAHGVVGIGWGGKRDHATWFSAEPTAVLGIQVIPMSSSSAHLAVDPDRVTANVAAPRRPTGTPGRSATTC